MPPDDKVTGETIAVFLEERAGALDRIRGRIGPPEQGPLEYEAWELRMLAACFRENNVGTLWKRNRSKKVDGK